MENQMKKKNHNDMNIGLVKGFLWGLLRNFRRHYSRRFRGAPEWASKIFLIMQAFTLF